MKEGKKFLAVHHFPLFLNLPAKWRRKMTQWWLSLLTCALSLSLLYLWLLFMLSLSCWRCNVYESKNLSMQSWKFENWKFLLGPRCLMPRGQNFSIFVNFRLVALKDFGRFNVAVWQLASPRGLLPLPRSFFARKAYHFWETVFGDYWETVF